MCFLLWSRYPGQGFEQFVESIVAGGDLLGYKAEKKKQVPQGGGKDGSDIFRFGDDVDMIKDVFNTEKT